MKRWGWVLLVLVAVVVAAHDAWPRVRAWREERVLASDELLVQRMIKRLRARKEVSRIERDADDPLGLRVWLGDEEHERNVYLGNLQAALREMSTAEREAQLAKFIEAVVAPSQGGLTWEEVTPRLIPVIRDDPYVARSQQRGMRLVGRPLVAGLGLYVVIDLEDRSQYVTEPSLEEWHVDAARVFEAAFANLAGMQRSGSPLRGKLWHLAEVETYGSSLLALPAWRASATQQVGKRLAFAIPDHARLLFAPADDVGALEALHQAAVVEWRDAVRPLSPDLYVEDERGQLTVAAHPALDEVLLRTREAFLTDR